jgi:hypothetical protein
VKTKRFVLTVMSIVLTLSIGLVSINSPYYTIAQNEGLAQDGSNGEADQDIEQLQASNQDNQVVSGDRSIASGNNFLCQTMNNIDVNSIMDTDCQNEGVGGGPQGFTAIDVRTFDDQGLRPSNMLLTVTDSSGQEVLRQTSMAGNIIHFFDPNPSPGSLVIKGTYTNGTAITKDIVTVEGKLIPTFGPDRPIDCEITERNVFECIGEAGTNVIPLNNQIRVSVTSN